jgi:alpha-mannosidase
MPRQVAVVPHTHWDREWYAPFQSFRLRLVELLDELIPRLESDPSAGHFLLDGQMAVVDDYLAIRPEAEDALRRLAVSGRVAMGPWYILMDEFLVSGETMIRNLQLGLEKAGRFGGAMEVGYLPDMFGHIAQMPQLLSQFGLQHAVVWRGVPLALDKSAFWWEAPDGSKVRAEYLPQGYGNGAYLPDDPKAVVQALRDYVGETQDMLLDPILWMNGADHLSPKPWLSRVVSEANRLQSDFKLEVMSLSKYLGGAPTEGLPSWRGELRSGARSNLLMGVASNRTDVRQAAVRTERALEQWAEPLCALFLSPKDWPARLFDEAWREVILNSAHDSICACSHDEVVDAVLHRFAEARQIADGLADRAVASLAGTMSVEGPVLINATPRERAGLAECWLPGDVAPQGTQQLLKRDPVLFDLTVLARELAPIIAQFRGRLHDSGLFVAALKVDDTRELVTVTVTFQKRLDPALQPTDPRLCLSGLAEKRPDVKVRVVGLRPQEQHVLVRAEKVAGYGWQAWKATPSAVPAATASEWKLSNGLVKLEVDPGNGTFSVEDSTGGRLTGLGKLVDGGDGGDTYNYSPPDHDQEIDKPLSVKTEVVEAGPLRAVLAIDRTYVWPERIKAHARVGEVPTRVRTLLELQAGEALVRVTFELENRARDHRLRVHLPLSGRAQRSEAECAFTIVQRGLTAEGGPNERPLPTFPSRRFVKAGSLTVVHEGLTEYELVDQGSTLALTLLRATGLISQREMSYRPLPAGPSLPLEGAQVQGRHRLRMALQLRPGNPYELVDQAFVPLLAVEATGGGKRAASGQELQVAGAEISALVRRGGRLELRAFNPTPKTTTLTVRTPSGAPRGGFRVDLRGRPLERFEGSVSLGPWVIATLRLDAE